MDAFLSIDKGKPLGVWVACFECDTEEIIPLEDIFKSFEDMDDERKMEYVKAFHSFVNRQRYQKF